MHVVACGSKEWTDRRAIKRELKRLPKGSMLIHGPPRDGAIKIIDEEAKKLGIQVLPINGDSTLRNAKMITDGNPDKVLAFYNPEMGRCYDTKDIIEMARRVCVPVKLVMGKEACPAPKVKRAAHKPTAPKYCPICGSRRVAEVRSEIVCDHCHTIIDTCCG